MLSFGMLLAFAFAITSRSLLLFAGSAPPSLTAIAILSANLHENLTALGVGLLFLFLMFAHLECPDIRPPKFALPLF